VGLFSFFKKQDVLPFDLSLIGVDMHSHLIPGIDDGSNSMDETIAMLAKFEHLGYRKVITTPHIMSEVYNNTSEIILKGLDEVRVEAKKHGLKIEIDAAAEYYFDDYLVDLVKKREVLTFGDQYVLVEFSFHTPPVYDDILFFEMQMARYKPVLAHFERYPYFHGSTEKAKEYRDKGAQIQVNINSLTGNYGPEVRKQAEKLIDQNLVDFIGSDCHRMQHLVTMEANLTLPYISKLSSLALKNQSLG
jgi:tyrosine-protein phosphatase YwqE